MELYEEEDKLILRKDFYLKSDVIFVSAGAGIFTAIVVFIIWLVVIFTYGEFMLEAFLYTSFIPLIVAIIPILELLLHRHYRNRAIEWVFDLSQEKIILQRISPTVQQLKSYNFTDLVAICFTKKMDWTEWVYSVGLQMKSKKRIKLYSKNIPYKRKKYVARPEPPIDLGYRLGEFLEVPYIYRKSFTKFILFIFGALALLLGLGFFLTFIHLAGLLLVSMISVFIIIFIIITMKKFKEKF